VRSRHLALLDPLLRTQCCASGRGFEQSALFIELKRTGVMRALVGEAVLTAWERTRELPEQEAALAVLALALPEHNINELANLPLSERNALLLELRAATLGWRMHGFAVCPECDAQLELVLDARELAEGIRGEDTPRPNEIAGYTMRAANTLDLLAATAAESEEHARSILVARTVNVTRAELDQANQFASPRRTGHWLESQPQPIVDLLLDRFEQMNAAAEIRAQFHCADCRSRACVDVDIVHFFLREIAGAARRLMTDIHELASAYGWSERSIAIMSDARRAAYVEMLHA
jgi:hypothetical protein